MSKVRRRDVLLIAIVVLQLMLAIDARRYGGSVDRAIVRAAQLAAKVKRESGTSNDQTRAHSGNDGDKADPSDAAVIYDQRQGNGETNIRLSIKNVKIQLPESELVRFQKSNMMQLIKNSVLRLLGLGMEGDSEAPEATSRSPPVVPPTSTEQQPIGNIAQSLPELIASMLQVNGTNVPAKFFLEISDFLMNTSDNDAVDDMRVETNHNHQQQLEQQQLEQQLHRFQQQQQQHNHQMPPQPAQEPFYGTEEITIERLENTTNVRNQTITISKRRHQLGPLPMDGSALETVSKENHQSTNTTRNATESSDRFVQTKPIRLDTLQVTVTNEPKTLREKVVWKVPSEMGVDGSSGH
uniref:Uncharacterized protein n=1 Tax=Anopheles epiroticus TaxID=199890 RepID=A0A182P680_9DIPT